jgi:DNA-3-methyladenine glycosylase II
MQYTLATARPFSFAQSLAFIRRFPAVRHEYLVTADAVTAAVALDGRAVPFTLRATPSLVVETSDERAARMAASFVGATDDVAGFYARAEGDGPLGAVIEQLYGLHHVRFLSLGEVAVYSVLMQRAPIAIAAALKRKFLAAFGHEVIVDGHVLRAMPELARLAELDSAQIAKAIGHAMKGERIAAVVRGVAALGEDWLRTAPYGEARAALLELPGIGPFSAGAILLRGLGRMDELPSHRNFEEAGRAVYGAAFDPEAIAARYGRSIGYWAFYVMASEGRGGAPMAARKNFIAPEKDRAAVA